MQRAVMNIAHRGFSGRYPENTLVSFAAAFDLGCEWIECDIRSTADGVPVVIHDATVDRTTDGTGRIDALRYEDVRRLDAGSRKTPEFRGERIPTLYELLDLVHRRGRRVVIEMKTGAERLRPAIDIIRGHSAFPLTDVSAFERETVETVRRLVPGWRMTWLLRTDGFVPADAIRECVDLGVAIIGPHARVTDRAFVDAAHDAGLLVRAWGLGDDRGPELRRLVDAGVDGMTTNWPDALMGIIRQREGDVDARR